nr:cell adhesion molecule Dscam2-like [Cherax quadricarinatus]
MVHDEVLVGIRDEWGSTGVSPKTSAIFSSISVCEESGPVIVEEPDNRVDFSNSTGANIHCSVRGHPKPTVVWVKADDGTAIGDVPGLRKVLSNGTLMFPPFRAEDYRQEVHAQVYRCQATNPHGTVHSRDVHVRAVVHQEYQTDVVPEYVILGNSAILKCNIPSFVADFVSVQAWLTDKGQIYYPSDNYVVPQAYLIDVSLENVIRGNSAILKCNIPSFVADFVSVQAWVTDKGDAYYPTQNYDGKYLVLPSGELHIRSVSSEDGFKSYKCRTVHRLTQETRLSATAGRLVISEPVGISGPKLPSSDKLHSEMKARATNLSLTCPAQAHPPPQFR